MAFVPGTVVGSYRLIREIARGGMGVVWLAEQERLGRRVALKVIAPELAADPSFRARFTRESRMAALIEHPNVVPIYEAAEIEGELLLAMRYVEGADLRELLRREGRLAPERAVAIVTQVAAALDAAHAQGLVHRDIKPANVLVNGDHTYLSDFGLTKRVAASVALTRGGEWVGTVDYVAPEQVRGEPVDHRADVYSLGCVLYEAVTGRVPYERDSEVAKLWAHVNDPPPSLAAAPDPDVRALDPIVAKAMALHPEARFVTAGDLARTVAVALNGGPATVLEPEPSYGPGPGATLPGTAPPGAWDPPPPPRRRSAAVAVALVIAAAVLALGGIAAAVIASGALDDESGETRTDAGPERTTTTTSTPTPHTPAAPRVGEGLEPYSTATYSAALPPDWRMTQDYVFQGRNDRGRERYVTELRRGAATLILDTTLDLPESDPADSARKLERGARANASYERIEFGRDRFGDNDAFVWVYAADGEYAIDIFFYVGGHGYAVLGKSPPAGFGEVRSVAEQVAASVTAGE